MGEWISLLLEWDYFLFGWINQSFTHPALDPFFLKITALHKDPAFKFFVFPALVVWGAWVYRLKFLKWVLALGIVIGVTDAFNYRVLKALSQRARPAFTPQVEAVVRTEKSPSDPSLPSNHAANMFAGAAVLSVVMPHLRLVLFAFAFFVAYSRPYLGVHFPFDVLLGAFVGFCIARILTRQVFQRFNWWEFPAKNSADSGRSQSSLDPLKVTPPEAPHR